MEQVRLALEQPALLRSVSREVVSVVPSNPLQGAGLDVQPPASSKLESNVRLFSCMTLMRTSVNLILDVNLYVSFVKGNYLFCSIHTLLSFQKWHSL